MTSDHVVATGEVVKKIETVYVAGPYTVGVVEENVRLAITAANSVMDLGLSPYVPHLAHYMHQVRERTYEEWMTLDFAWLDRCDSLLRLPGLSPGADREVLRAVHDEKPVFHSIEALVQYVKASK